MLEKLKEKKPFALVDTFAPHEAWDPPSKHVARTLARAFPTNARKRLFRRDDESGEVADDNKDVVDRLWQTLISASGGLLPRLGAKGAIGPDPDR